MYKHTNKWISCLLILLLLCGLTACKRNMVGATPETLATAVPVATQTATETPVAESGDAARQSMLQAYRTALMNLLHQHVLPDGTDCGYDDFSDTAQNQFAVCDVDGDGQDELIVAYTTTYMAGQTQGVFAYDADSGQCKTELTEFPLLTFYDNGTVQAGWSHNQGLAGSFWPYSLYRYDAATDAYKLVGMADAWEKAFAPQDYNGNPYPDEVDASGTGFVYYMMEKDASEAVPPVDAAVYEAWRASFLGNAAELHIPYLALTDENIAALS